MNSVIRFATGTLLAATVTIPSSCSAEKSQATLVGGAHFSEAFFNTLYGHPVDDSNKVRERIKSAITTGTSRTKGNVTVELVPESSHGRMDIRLRGTVNIDDGVGSQRSFRVCSRSVSQVDVRKPVIFDRDGLHTEPASARCSTRIQICDVQAKHRLVERLAARRSHRSLNETECIVTQRTAQRFEDRLDNRISTAIEDLDGQIREQLQFDQAGFDFLPPEVSFASTNDYLQAWIKPQTDREVSPPPHNGFLDTSLDIHVVLHEQAFDTLAEYRFAGRRVHDHEVRDGVEACCGSVPQSLRVDPRQSPWSMKMADTQPLMVRLPDGKIHVVIRLADFQNGPDVLTGPMQVELTLRPEITADGPRLHRITAPLVHVDATGKTEPSDKDSRLTDLLRQKIEGIFPPDFVFDRQASSEDDTSDKLKDLAMTRLNVVHEWFEMGFQFEAETQP